MEKQSLKLVNAASAKAAKRARSAQSSASTQSSAAVVSSAQRNQMIAEAAYYKACARGFSAGDELQDWLQAEQEVNARLM